jgi:hypothetical protein
MNVKEFLVENFTAKNIEKFEKEYKKKYSRQAYSQFIRIDLSKFNEYRWQLLADYFTGGDVEKIFSMYCKQKRIEKVIPENVKAKIVKV